MWENCLFMNKAFPRGEDTLENEMGTVEKYSNLNTYDMMYGIATTNLSLQYTDATGFNGNHNAAVLTNVGIICISIVYHSGSKDTPSYYTYRGVNGFIPSGAINTAIFSHGILHSSMKIYTNGGAFYSVSGHLDNLSAPIEDILQDYEMDNSLAGTQVVLNNLFDLNDDPSFAGISQHTVNIKNYFGDHTGMNNVQLVGVKGRYTPTFNSKIFNDCIHLRKFFITSFDNNGILSKLCLTFI